MKFFWPPLILGAAAVRRANRVSLIPTRRPNDDSSGSINAPHLLTPVPSLRSSCLSYLVDLISSYLKGASDAQVTFDDLTRKYFSREYGLAGAAYALRNLAFPTWPEALAQDLVKRLCKKHLFNLRSVHLLQK